MLAKDPAERITAAAILEQPWLVEKHTYSGNDLKASTSQLTQYLDGSLQGDD
jgi:serine/threonine protein kinase